MSQGDRRVPRAIHNAETGRFAHACPDVLETTFGPKEDYAVGSRKDDQGKPPVTRGARETIPLPAGETYCHCPVGRCEYAGMLPSTVCKDSGLPGKWAPPVSGARKDDQGKPPVTRGCLHYFPRALAEVAKISAFGAKKYAWDGWRDVPDWEHRYPDALGRHLLATKGDLHATDPETGELEWAHIAWNALAVLEKILAEDAKP